MKILDFSPKQWRSLALANKRVNIWHGAVRGGKSLVSLAWFANQIKEHDGNGDILMVAKTERQIRRNIIKPMTELLGKDNVSVNIGLGEARILNQTVYVAGANDERSEQKIRGGTFAKIYGDEVSLWPESFFKMCLTRMSPPGACLGGTTNPDSPLHWLYRDYISRAKELNHAEFHFELDDNPALSQDFKDAIRREFVGLWYKRFIEGLWVMAEGVIWDAYAPELHDVARVPDGVKIVRHIVGVDYGTSNPFVALLIGIGSDSRMYVISEYRHDSKEAGRQLTDGEYSKELKAWIDLLGVVPRAWYVDPSAASFRLQLSKDHGWPVIEADNDVDDGLRIVALTIATDRLKFVVGSNGKGCEKTRQEIVCYAWDPKAQEKGEDKPIKKADHGPDALRYAVYTYRAHDIGNIDQYGWVA